MTLSFSQELLTDISQYFSPDYELDVRPSNMDNNNSKEYIDRIRTQVIENLKRSAHAPSVQMTDVPRHGLIPGLDDETDAMLDDLDEDENKDARFTKRRFDQYVEKEGELSESEDEEMAETLGVRRQPNGVKRRNQANYQDMEPESGVNSGMATPLDASSVADDEPMDDERMDDITETDALDKKTPTPTVEPSTRPVSRMETDDISVAGRNTAPSAEAEEKNPVASPPASRQESAAPNVTDDTVMEDATPAPAQTPAPPSLKQEPAQEQEPTAGLEAAEPPTAPSDAPVATPPRSPPRESSTHPKTDTPPPPTESSLPSIE